MQFLRDSFTLFRINKILYNRTQVCYNICMGILSFFKQLFFKQRLRKSGLHFPIPCKIHGVKSMDRQGALAQSRAGDRLQLVHSAEKDYPFNVYVYSVELNRILGYLDAVLAEKLVYVFGKGLCLDGEIEKLTGGAPDYAHIGCNISIFQTTSIMQDFTDFSHLHS